MDKLDDNKIDELDEENVSGGYEVIDDYSGNVVATFSSRERAAQYAKDHNYSTEEIF